MFYKVFFYFLLFLGFWLSSVLFPGVILPGYLWLYCDWSKQTHEYLLPIRNRV